MERCQKEVKIQTNSGVQRGSRVGRRSDSLHIFIFFFFSLQAIWRCSHQEQVRGRMREGRESAGERREKKNITVNVNQAHSRAGEKYSAYTVCTL